MLFSMPDIAGLELRVVDVVTEDGLLETYGERVPVLQLFTQEPACGSEGAGAVTPEPELVLELAWPFSPESVGDALRKL